MDSSVFLEHSTTILSHILEKHALHSEEQNQQSKQDDPLIAYSLLIYVGREDPRWMKFVVSEARRNKQNRLFQKIVSEVAALPSHRSMAVAVQLAFEMCKVAKLRSKDFGRSHPRRIVDNRQTRA